MVYVPKSEVPQTWKEGRDNLEGFTPLKILAAGGLSIAPLCLVHNKMTGEITRRVESMGTHAEKYGVDDLENVAGNVEWYYGFGILAIALVAAVGVSFYFFQEGGWQSRLWKIILA